MWQATRKAAELIKLVTYCNKWMHTVLIYHAHTHMHKNEIKFKLKKNIFKRKT